jgi:phage-related minor tail protein
MNSNDGIGSGSGAGGSGGVDFTSPLAKARALNEEIGNLKTSLIDAEKTGKSFGANLTNSFVSAIVRGKSLGDTLKGVALSLSQSILKQAFAPLGDGIGGFVSSALKGFGFANGAAFQNGGVVPFAGGGVISSPMTFPLSGGRMGLAGEAGPEAIMPLQRGSDGRLGVAAVGGNSGPNITINISTPDAESFRRSETQVAAMIARAAQLGQRNL